MKVNIRYKWNKRLSLICVAVIFTNILLCQCPGKGFFKATILSVYNVPGIANENQLKQLLDLHRQMNDCHIGNDSVKIYLLQKIGILYFKKSDFLNAVNYTIASNYVANICIKTHTANYLSLVDNYYNLQYYYGLMNNPKKKFEAIDSCIAYSMKGSAGFQKIIYVLRDKANYSFNKGEYSSCIREASLGLNIIQQYTHGSNKDSIELIISFTTNIANALIFSKDIITAEQLLLKQKTRFEQTNMAKHLAPVYSLLGLIKKDRKNYSQAISYFQKAFHASSTIKFKSGCAQSLVYIGMINSKGFNRHDEGLKYCAAALKYADAADSLFILKETGNIYVRKGMFNKAQFFFQQAFNTIQPNMNETNILKNSFAFPGFNILQSLLDLLVEKGDACLQAYRYTKNIVFFNTAIGIYKKADMFLAKIKTDQQLQLQSNLVWRGSADSLYEHAIEACYKNNDLENAFYFFEKSRSILLNDQINEQRWMADEDIAKQSRLKKRLIELEINLSSLPPSSMQYATIQNKLYSTGQELDALLRNIKEKNPLFYHDYLDTSFITIQQVKNNILHHTKSLLEIFAGNNAVYVLTVTPTNQSLIQINKQLYDSQVNVYNSFTTRPQMLNKNFNGFVKTSNALYRLIFKNNIPPSGSLIISPGGKIFPFEALVTNNNNQSPHYLLNQYATSYTYSVKYLTNQFAANTNKSNSVLGIAPVQYKNHPYLSALSGSGQSLEKINNYYSNSTNYVLEKATKNIFLQNFPRYNIIQLYTHASDSSATSDPVIYFADSALYLSALIPDQKPVTQLVVLSACETANGKLYKGEGIFSFNRGFAALGIPAAVSNLWSVDNESTYRVTELFYKYLSRGIPSDIALQKAKMEFIDNSSSKEKKLPYFWAASILTGKVDTIKSNVGMPWKGIVASVILLLCISYFTKNIILKRKKKSNMG